MNRLCSFLNYDIPCGSLFGIPITMHSSFLMLLGLHLARSGSADGSAIAGASPMLFLVCMGIILLRELGHASVAHAFGYSTKEISLTGIGGIALLDMPTDHASTGPRLAVSCGGPAVNVGIFVFGMTIFGWPDFGSLCGWLDDGTPGWSAWYALVMNLNGLIFLFNMLPIVPLDGGQILHHLTALLLGHPAARIAALLSTSTIGITCVWLSATRSLWPCALLIAGMASLGIFGLYWDPSKKSGSENHEKG